MTMQRRYPFSVGAIAPAILFLLLEHGLSVSLSASPVKNVLFIISDDLRANVLGCYGNTICQTPNIDKLSREGLVFDRAYCQGTLCATSRTSLMFSRYKGTGPVNLGQHFKDNGWYSARVGKIYHMRVPGDIIDGTDGKDIANSWTERFNSPGKEAHTEGDYACLNLNIFTKKMEGRQSTRMPHRMFVSVEYDGDGSDQPDHKTATKTIDLLRQQRDSRFFIAAGFVRPHYPMVAPRQFFTRYRWQDIETPTLLENDLDDIPLLGLSKSRSSTNQMDRFPDNQRRMWAAYYASVTFMDEQVGRILTELERLGLRQNTAIVFTSDHGYHLGDHTFWQKANVHEQVTRVPLIISLPGFRPGRSSSISELVDIFPTLSEVCGLEIPANLHGVSLVPVLNDSKSSVKNGALSFAQGASWRTKDWAYMRYSDRTEELYDMKNDPDQFHNLIGDSEFATIRQKLSNQLSDRLNRFGIAANRP